MSVPSPKTRTHTGVDTDTHNTHHAMGLRALMDVLEHENSTLTHLDTRN